jgi:tRNA U34 5-carboxymethylaminomethyl modifying GTPase MnmE/TrmE
MYRESFFQASMTCILNQIIVINSTVNKIKKMGCFMSKKKNSKKDEELVEKGCQILLLGLDNAGKTSMIFELHHFNNLAIMNTLKLGTTVDTIPTVGFNIENLVGIKDTSLTVLVCSTSII